MKKTDGHERKVNKSEKVLLALLPFWDPQIPPLGIACLKSYLQKYNFVVKAVDANIEMKFRDTYDHYFNILKSKIPVNKTGNIFNIGNQVLRNHLTAYLNHRNETDYVKLVKILVQKTFYFDLDESAVSGLNKEVSRFFSELENYLVRLLDEEKPTVLGLSVYGDTFASSLFAFKLAKERYTGIRTVMGGGIFADQLAPGSPELDFFINEYKNYIDKMIIGEGEELLLMFLRDELEESQKVFGLPDLHGETIDISSCDIPDFSDFNLDFYPHLAHYGARSCPFQCKFCSETVNWGNYRKKNVRQVVTEFNRMSDLFSCKLFLMTDSTLNPIITALAEEIIRTNTGVYWDGFLRADKHVCSVENTLLWRRGGFYRAKLGLESGSQRVLDLMDKRVKIDESEAALASLAYAGIKTTTFWLFGFPGETEEDFQKTLDFVEKCKDNIYEADCNVFNYYLSGQVNSVTWMKHDKYVSLYPEWMNKILITGTFVLGSEKYREEGYRRLNIFIERCKHLGIPNPYSLEDIKRADERWKKLHQNAVPPLIELKIKNSHIDETVKVKKFAFVENIIKDDEKDWF